MLSATSNHDQLAYDWDYLGPRVNPFPRELVLEFAVRNTSHIPGNIIEFGVANGDSTRVIRNTLSKLERFTRPGSRKKIFACDSFKGLPEKYENAEVGTFACKPPRIRGVEIVEGYFQDSLTEELARRVGNVSVASLDADLYSSTLCALRWLTPLLQTGSLLLFDEFLGENESEKRAFEQWSEETKVATVMVAEFMRDPSGWGTKIDKRAIYQVVTPDEISRKPLAVRARVARYLQPLRATAGRIKRAIK
jgi:Macrocin-O-methyltransferase (TylF)